MCSELRRGLRAACVESLTGEEKRKKKIRSPGYYATVFCLDKTNIAYVSCI